MEDRIAHSEDVSVGYERRKDDLELGMAGWWNAIADSEVGIDGSD